MGETDWIAADELRRTWLERVVKNPDGSIARAVRTIEALMAERDNLTREVERLWAATTFAPMARPEVVDKEVLRVWLTGDEWGAYEHATSQPPGSASAWAAMQFAEEVAWLRSLQGRIPAERLAPPERPDGLPVDAVWVD